MWRAFTPISHGAHSAQRPLEARPALEGRIQQAFGGRLSIVVAAPGYGKSTVLTRMARLDPRPRLWYWCADGDTGASLARHVAGAAAGPFAADPEEAHPDWATALEAVLSTVSEPHVLLVDDVDRLPPADLNRLVEVMAGERLRGWHTALTSRRELADPRLDAWLRAGEALRMDELDLAFDSMETRQALADMGGDESNWARLFDETRGWPMGLLRSPEAEGFGHYFWREVIERQPVAVRNFLEETAVLDTLSPTACQAVSGRRVAGPLLDHVISAHLFVLPGPDGFSYQPQFRSALLERTRGHQPRRLARAYARAVEHYTDSGDAVSAMRVIAGRRDRGRIVSSTRLLELLRQAAPRAVAASHGTDLADWLARFPPELATDPWVLHYRGVALRLSGADHDTAWRLQEQARDGFAASGESEGRIFAIAELGTLACLLNRPADAERLLEEARVGLARADSHLHASVLCALADAYVSLNRFGDAALAGEEALAIAGEGRDGQSSVSAHVQALYRLARVNFREGHLAKVLELGVRANDLGRKHPLDAESGVLGRFTLGIARWAGGELEQALELFSAAANQALGHGLTGLAHSIQADMAEVLAGLERFEEADALIQAIDSSSMFNAQVGTLRYLQDRWGEALTCFRRELERASQAGSAADVGRAKAALGAVCLRIGRVVEAEQWLLDAARSFERSGARFRLAGAQLQLAQLYAVRNTPASSRKHLHAALEYASEAGTYIFFLWHPAVVAPMAAQALVEGIQPDHVETLCCRRLSASQLHAFLPLLSHPETAVRERAMRIVRALVERGGERLAVAELDQCRDEAARARLTSALAAERLTSHGLVELRHQRGLTWAELDTFVAYYLNDPQTLVDSSEPNERRVVAQRLQLSENTLMHHITSIRRKLGFGARRGPAAVYLWALLSDISRLKIRASAPPTTDVIAAEEPGIHRRNGARPND
jgi:LuxR family maltose regulon positive regulatory protein